MTTLTAGFFAVRWGLLSALLMFISSVLNIRSKQAGYSAIAILFSLFGLLMACWFVFSASGVSPNAGAVTYFFSALKGHVLQTLSDPETQRALYTSML